MDQNGSHLQEQSNGFNKSERQITLPTITLDTTLVELYRRGSSKNANKKIAQVVCGVSSAIALSDELPRNVKYLYQDGPFNTLPQTNSTDDENDLRKDLAMKYLSLMPQRDALACGAMPVVLFHAGAEDVERREQDEVAVRKTLEILDERQKPRLVFCEGPGDIPVEAAEIDLMAFKIVLDGFEDLPMAVDLEKHWWVNSKEALARSVMPTPRCEFIELEGYCGQAETCCERCREDRTTIVSAECTGARGRWLEEQSDRVLSKLRS